ncbi:Flavodoxin/Radical SAM superfamily/Wyosine base formation [Novymonas esmeraldas]|uniref:tRNA 4-demethylwyosine synthase (AdoMet-dependent) n=1 Tax=Novymonas esmeraldas TaxID=1808958 RepID=A0AAW0EYL4_9TRYP
MVMWWGEKRRKRGDQLHITKCVSARVCLYVYDMAVRQRDGERDDGRGGEDRRGTAAYTHTQSRWRVVHRTHSALLLLFLLLSPLFLCVLLDSIAQVWRRCCDRHAVHRLCMCVCVCVIGFLNLCFVFLFFLRLFSFCCSCFLQPRLHVAERVRASVCVCLRVLSFSLEWVWCHVFCAHTRMHTHTHAYTRTGILTWVWIDPDFAGGNGAGGAMTTPNVQSPLCALFLSLSLSADVDELKRTSQRESVVVSAPAVHSLLLPRVTSWSCNRSSSTLLPPPPPPPPPPHTHTHTHTYTRSVTHTHAQWRIVHESDTTFSLSLFPLFFFLFLWISTNEGEKLTQRRVMLGTLLQLLGSLALPLIAFLLYERLVTTSPHARGGAAAASAHEAVTEHHLAATEAVAAFDRDVSAELERLGGSRATAPTPASKPVEVVEEAAATSAEAALQSPAAADAPFILIAYATQSQNSLALAHKLFSIITAHLHTTRASTGDADVCPAVRVLEMREEDEDGGVARAGSRNVCRVDTLLEQRGCALVIFIASTFTDGLAPPRSQAFEAMLKDACEDHRVPRDALGRRRFAVFGLGDVAYGEARFNAFARHLHEWCRGLGAPPFVVPPVYATEAKAQSLFRIFSTALVKWLSRASFHADGTVTVRKKPAPAGRGDGSCSVATADVDAEAAAASTTCGSACCGNDSGGACCQSGDPTASRHTAAAGRHYNAEDVEEDVEEEEEDGATAGGGVEDDMEDVEDLVWDGTDDAAFDPLKDPGELPELLYPKLRQSLEKQGYRLIGTHSGVKLCRWTKSMLRGRGGCYKHTFYAINSSQCMEMTPSLACANKCVFCWRHHTNPISRHFRWKQDPPELLIAQGMAGHYQMIRQMRGVPGVSPERLATAMQIRHCALSLVGEPIMYPQINAFCDLLHQHHISSFMVTNAQFPEQLRDLKPVVQLYLSIDAPTPEELKRIDRPLFEDYWDRCLSCVKELAKKPQRTVFRLTLVNQYNTENIRAYADLVEMGQPDFIEVKGVTYCGTSTSSTLTMKENVPRHDEVIGFCAALCAEMARRHPHHRTPQMDACDEVGSGNDDGEEEENEDDGVIVIPVEERHRPYHIACEHEHSCCVLIALDKFFFDGHWHTWIDYDRFYTLVESGRVDFTSLDYAARTPTWATRNSKERGFDPAQTRIVRKNARPTVVTAGC